MTLVPPWAPPPNAGDVVQCRFPEGMAGKPGPKDRPALVLQVEENPGDPLGVIVQVAFGTSQNVDQRYPGELTISAADPKHGLSRDTKFDLGNSVRLPFDAEWFAPAPAPDRHFVEHPKRGALNLRDQKVKRALQAAIVEAKTAGRI